MDSGHRLSLRSAFICHQRLHQDRVKLTSMSMPIMFFVYRYHRIPPNQLASHPNCCCHHLGLVDVARPLWALVELAVALSALQIHKYWDRSRSASDLPQECGGTRAHGRSACSLLDLECDRSASWSVSWLQRSESMEMCTWTQKSNMPVQKPQSMVLSGVSRIVSSGAACVAGTAVAISQRAKASDKIVSFMLVGLRMLCGCAVFESFHVIKKWRLMVAAAGNECWRQLTGSGVRLRKRTFTCSAADR